MKTLIAIFAAVLMVGIAGAAYADSGTGDPTTPAEASLDVRVLSGSTIEITIGDPASVDSLTYTVGTPSGGYITDDAATHVNYLIRYNADDATEGLRVQVDALDLSNGVDTISSTDFQVRSDGGSFPDRDLGEPGIPIDLTSYSLSGEYSDTITIWLNDYRFLDPGLYTASGVGEPMMRFIASIVAL